MNIYIFEDQTTLNLEPITLTRPSCDLRCGAFTFLERIKQLYPDNRYSLIVRDELAAVTSNLFPDLRVNPSQIESGLWLKGPVLWNHEKMVFDKIPGTVLISNGEVVAAQLTAEQGRQWLAEGGPLTGAPSQKLQRIEIDVPVVHYLWDCVNLNGEAIISDGDLLNLGTELHNSLDNVHIVEPTRVSVGDGSKLKPGVVLDAENGPVIIDANVNILSHVYIQGPVFIGDGCQIKAGAKIYGGTSIGPGCKVGGEIVSSIFQSWTNKQHDGFIGHAYIGEWVNLGADTNNSDLKNNYTEVKVTVNGKVVNTGSSFVGLFMGDHGKSGINTMFNTGTSIGPGANVVGYGYPPVNIAPLSWVTNGKSHRYQFEKFCDTARKVKARRGKAFTTEEEQLYRHLWERR